MKNPVQIPVIFDGLRTMADGSVKFSFATRELHADDLAALLSYRKQEGYLLFKPAPFEESDLIDIPETVPEFRNSKTPSERLRGVLYRLWEFRGSQGNFEAWRTEEMERIITHYKGKLP